MRNVRTRFGYVAALLLIACVAVNIVSTAGTDDDKVVFNTQSHKYHCATCEYAVRCTKNCVTITKEEAIKRGGVACKVCGGTCKKGS